MITSILKERIGKFRESNDIFYSEQKEGKKIIWLQRSALYVWSKQKSLRMTWIDNKKAFDSVLNEWILEVLNILNIFPLIVTFLKYKMER